MATPSGRCLFARARLLCGLAHRLSYKKQDLYHSWHYKFLKKSFDVHLKYMQLFCVQHTTFHRCALLHKEREKFDEEKLECVNIYSPTGTLIIEGQPLIYLDRLCKYFPSYTYTNIDSSNNPVNLRNFKLERKRKTDQSELQKSSNRKRGPQKIKVSSMTDSKSLKKLKVVLVDSGEALLILKPASRTQKSAFELEQNVKEFMQGLCTFALIKSEAAFHSTFELRRKKEDDDFYKTLFAFIYKRDKTEVDLMIDCAKTVKSFSEKKDENVK